MSTPFLGEIRCFPYNFAVQGWAYCDGQILPISQYTALFSLLGTTYGGNGTSTFALPDIRSRVAVGQGQGVGLSEYVLGEEIGLESVTVLQTEMAQHTHLVQASSAVANASSPTAGTFAVPNVDPRLQNLYSTSAANGSANASTVGLTGNSQPHNNIQPYLVMSYQIALQGIFPSRS